MTKQDFITQFVLARAAAKPGNIDSRSVVLSASRVWNNIEAEIAEPGCLEPAPVVDHMEAGGEFPIADGETDVSE